MFNAKDAKTFSLCAVALAFAAQSATVASQEIVETTTDLDKALQVDGAPTGGAESSMDGFQYFLEGPAEDKRYIVSFKERKAPIAFIPPVSGLWMSPMDSAIAPISGPDQKAVIDGVLQEVDAKDILRKAGATTIRTMKKQSMIVANMNPYAASRLAQDPNVESVSIDARRSLMAESTPYGISMVQATQLNQNDPTRRRVCVIDTGYNLGHPDLPDQNDGVTGQGNNNQVGNWYQDGNGHGTHVAGTIGAIANNEGVVGVYPGVRMHIVKIFNDQGQWTFASDIITAIEQCQNAGANVVNMSLGGGGSSTAERNAMQGFVDDGMILVAAAGNSGNSTSSYPASYPAVISVAAVDSSENRASYSQYNSSVEIAAPGSAVSSTWPVNTYNSISGTSMATPHVAGVAALVWSFFPSCSNEQIRNVLNLTAKDKGSAGKDNFYGHGIVRARDAYDYIATNGCDGNGNGGGGGGSVTPVSGQLNNLADSRNNWKRYNWNVPAGVSQLKVEISGGSGDADLYMRFGADPQTGSYDCRPYKNGNNEVCTFNNPRAGEWKIGIRAYSTYNGVTMKYSYQ